MLIKVIEEKYWDIPEDLKEDYLNYLDGKAPNLINFEMFLDDNFYLDDIMDIYSSDVEFEINESDFKKFLNND